MLASALAYSTFFAIPSVLLVAVGAVHARRPGRQTITIADGALRARHAARRRRAARRAHCRTSTRTRRRASLMTVVGFVLALWSTTGAMTSFMTAINIAYDRKDGRSFVRKRLVAVEDGRRDRDSRSCSSRCCSSSARRSSTLIASHAGAAGQRVDWVWWIAQWPILLFGLLAAFATLLYLGPDIEHRRWTFFTPGLARRRAHLDRRSPARSPSTRRRSGRTTRRGGRSRR